MAGTFKFELVTPERIAIAEDASQVVVPGAEGEFTVLSGHAPIISALRPGVINAKLGDRDVRLFVQGGFAEGDAEHLTVLAERALDLNELSGSALAAEISRFETDLAEAADDRARFTATAALTELRALQR